VEDTVDATTADLTLMPTGLQAHLFAHKAAVTYPY